METVIDLLSVKHKFKNDADAHDIACRKVEQVSEETDSLRLALDKHTGRQHR